MASEPISKAQSKNGEGVADHRIGERLRKIRNERKLTLRALAARVGVTASLLSQVENGGVNPSVETLLRLADDLSVPVGFFFSEESPSEKIQAPRSEPSEELPVIVRAAHRNRIHLDGGIVWENLLPTNESGLEWMVIEYAPSIGSPAAMVQHNGREYGLMLSGSLIVKLGFIDHKLGPGDSIAFDATTPHQIRNDGPTLARGMWMIAGRHEVGDNATTNSTHDPRATS